MGRAHVTVSRRAAGGPRRADSDVYSLRSELLTVGKAMGRNKLIYALSDITVAARRVPAVPGQERWR